MRPKDATNGARGRADMRVVRNFDGDGGVPEYRRCEYALTLAVRLRLEITVVKAQSDGSEIYSTCTE